MPDESIPTHGDVIHITQQFTRMIPTSTTFALVAPTGSTSDPRSKHGYFNAGSC